jgi:uncharacterized protein (TIGR03663 family)
VALAMALVRLEGARTFSALTESDLRLTSVLAGMVSILLLGGGAVENFGFVPGLIAALLFAIGPLTVYYDRYFIHESLFVSATLGLIVSARRVRLRNSVLHAVLAGACAALMLACKETATIHFFALAAAALVFWRWDLHGSGVRALWRPQMLFSASGTFLLLTIVSFTWFGTNWKELPALLQAVPDFLARAGGQGHQKPFWYYAQLLSGGWSGSMLLALAAIGFFLTVTRRDRSPYRLLAYYAVLLAAVYSLIPYKTPWLALNLWLPVTLLAGRAVESSFRFAARRMPLRAAIPAFAIMGILASALIAHDTRQRVFLHPADETNPYAYVHTSEDILGLTPEIEQLARQNGIAAPRIAVIAQDSWPLPWYLRHFSQVGFWQPGQPVGEADFYITSTDAAELYKDQLKRFRPEFFGVRPGVLILLWSPEPK